MGDAEKPSLETRKLWDKAFYLLVEQKEHFLKDYPDHWVGLCADYPDITMIPMPTLAGLIDYLNENGIKDKLKAVAFFDSEYGGMCKLTFLDYEEERDKFLEGVAQG